MEDHIKNITELLSHSNWSKNDILRIMTAFRHIIEEKGFQSKYPYLNLYANWALHTKISGSITAFRILELLTDAVIAHNKNPNEGTWINDAVIEGLSLHLLKTNIENLCDELNISRALLSERANWKKFVQFLVTYELQRKPVQFPQNMKGKTKKIFDSIQEKASKTPSRNNAILGVSFLDYNGTLCWEINTEETIRKGFRIIGPIGIL
ncbi:hypothetical protein HYV69_00295 [Candidatus Uhrbacteria bacterium]|nr:hypothetical protein [Candidatus Uhrbacteria bacterium]